MLTPLLECFAEHFPIPTMARALLERSFHPEQLDAWFERQAEGQYTRTLLFSTLFELMMQVVTRRQPSVNAAMALKVRKYNIKNQPLAMSNLA